MFCEESTVKNFKNIKNIKVNWSPKLNLLVGPNGVGKTNILESFHILTGWGPFKSLRRSPLLNWNTDETRGVLKGIFQGEESVTVQSLVTTRCSMRFDGKRSNCGSIRYRIPALAFLPGDLALIEGTPGIRRRFLDIMCALLYPVYAIKLTEYRRGIRHKKALLMERRSVKLVDRSLAPLAEFLWICRQKAVIAIEMGLRGVRDLLPESIGLTLAPGGGASGYDVKTWYGESSDRCSHRERFAGRPLIGPHRDDLVLTARGMNVSMRFSRGQRRRASLALIMAAGWAVERKLRRAPILLLDEVASELDSHGREIIVDVLHRSGWQVFAATAEDDLVNWPGVRWSIRDGELREGNIK